VVCVPLRTWDATVIFAFLANMVYIFSNTSHVQCTVRSTHLHLCHLYIPQHATKIRYHLHSTALTAICILHGTHSHVYIAKDLASGMHSRTFMGTLCVSSSEPATLFLRSSSGTVFLLEWVLSRSSATSFLSQWIMLVGFCQEWVLPLCFSQGVSSGTLCQSRS
jgi:hypothetical protein